MGKQFTTSNSAVFTNGALRRLLKLPARCKLCGQPLEGARYAFGGGFSCERCLRGHLAGASEPHIESVLREKAWIAVEAGAPPLAERVLCYACLTPVEGPGFAFGGGIACEACIRKYYRGHGEAEIQAELRARAVAAAPPRRPEKAAAKTPRRQRRALEPRGIPRRPPRRREICGRCGIPLEAARHEFEDGFLCEPCMRNRRPKAGAPAAEGAAKHPR